MPCPVRELLLVGSSVIPKCSIISFVHLEHGRPRDCDARRFTAVVLSARRRELDRPIRLQSGGVIPQGTTSAAPLMNFNSGWPGRGYRGREPTVVLEWSAGPRHRTISLNFGGVVPERSFAR